jgi:hypothetical protein
MARGYGAPITMTPEESAFCKALGERIATQRK